MLQKLRLDRTKHYELAVATKLIAEMLVHFIFGTEHDLELGSEQAGVEQWDDIVVKRPNGVYEHHQIKRQESEFSIDPIDNDKVRQGKNIGDTKERSALDSCIRSLGEWVAKNGKSNANPKRTFILEIPTFETQIKKGLPVRHFMELSRICRLETTLIGNLQQLADDDGNISNCFKWLTVWCGFIDWEQIKNTLELLEIRITKESNELLDQTLELLRRCFQNPQTALDQIKLFVFEEANYAGSFTPRLLFDFLRSSLLPTIATWTQYRFGNGIWDIAGTHDSGSSQVEQAPKVVASMWANNREAKVRFDVPLTEEQSPLANAILRLSLHLNALSTAYFGSRGEWIKTACALVGGTLGNNKDDFEGDQLRVVEIGVSLTPTDTRLVSLQKDIRLEAEALHSEMFLITWEKVCVEVRKKIVEVTAYDIQEAIEKRWQIWVVGLNVDSTIRNELMSVLLFANAEKGKISARFRVGVKTARLIAQGLFLMLVTSVALEDRDDCWKYVSSNLAVRTISLQCWSGPGNYAFPTPRKLTDHGIKRLIGKETASILILSELECPAATIYEESMAYDKEQDETMANPHNPDLLVTHTRHLKSILEDGNLSGLRKHLREMLDQAFDSRASSIEKASKHG